MVQGGWQGGSSDYAVPYLLLGIRHCQFKGSALMPTDRHTRHFRIGVIRASVRTTLRRLGRQYASLYRHFLVDHPQENEIRVEVHRQPISLTHRRRYQVTVNGDPHGEPVLYEEILPFIEWALAWRIPDVMPDYLQLHSSAMEVDGTGVIFPGQSGSGKSTLATALLARGWRYLCDEFALIHADTLMLHPYPRAICLKQPSYPVIESAGIRLNENHDYIKGAKGRVRFINAAAVREDAIGCPCPIGYVVFPKYIAGAKPTLMRISRAEAAFALHHVCHNLFKCRTLGIDVLTEMIRGASCYRLISGEINATCDLVEQLVQGSDQRRARSA